MAKIKLNRNRYRKGDLIEIVEDLNCIPAGVYKFEGHEAGFFQFSIKGAGVFGVSREYKSKIRKLIKTDFPVLTPPDRFIRHYYALMASKAGNLSGVNNPPTYCAVDPGALKYLEDGVTESDMH